VHALACDLGDHSKPAAFAERLWDFFFSRMTYGSVYPSTLSAEDPLGDVARNGTFDCYYGSLLAVALCHAARIPARVVAGWLIYPSVPSQHYWFEMLDDGAWVPYDLTGCWTLAMGEKTNKWSRYFFGRTDARMVTEELPFARVGPIGVPTPADWYFTQVGANGGGTRRRLIRSNDQRALLIDTVQVTEISHVGSGIDVLGKS
jgi:transglutaminase-like putative cysteine protease